MGVVCSTLYATNLHDETKLTPYDSWFTFPSSLPKFYPLETFHFYVPLGCLTPKRASSSTHNPHSPNASVQKRLYVYDLCCNGFIFGCAHLCYLSRAYWLKITSPNSALLLVRRCLFSCLQFVHHIIEFRDLTLERPINCYFFLDSHGWHK